MAKRNQRRFSDGQQVEAIRLVQEVGTLTAAMNLGTVLRERIGAGAPKDLAGLRLLVSLLMRVIWAARLLRQPVFKPRPTGTPAKPRRFRSALSRSE